MAKHAVVKKRKMQRALHWPVKVLMVKIDTLVVESLSETMRSVGKALQVTPKPHSESYLVKKAVMSKLLDAVCLHCEKYPKIINLYNHRRSPTDGLSATDSLKLTKEETDGIQKSS